MDRATEAGWQLRLAILWRGYASLLAAPALKGLAEEVLSRSFVPGLNEIVAGISTRSENALREERTRSLERVRKSAETIGPLISPVETIASTMLLRIMSTMTFFKPAEISDPASVRITPQDLSLSIRS